MSFTRLHFTVNTPPTSGVIRKYLLLKSSEVNKTKNTELITMPINIPVALQVDA